MMIEKQYMHVHERTLCINVIGRKMRVSFLCRSSFLIYYEINPIFFIYSHGVSCHLEGSLCVSNKQCNVELPKKRVFFSNFLGKESAVQTKDGKIPGRFHPHKNICSDIFPIITMKERDVFINNSTENSSVALHMSRYVINMNWTDDCRKYTHFE